MEETSRKPTILSSQKVNELDKNAMVWSMRITGVDLSVDKEMFGGVKMIKVMADSNDPPKIIQSRVSTPGK